MSKTTAYRNNIKNLEIETREVFEQETSSPENIQWTLPMNIVTWLDNNQMTLSTDSSKHSKKHETEVNLDPEPYSYDSSESFSLYSRARKKKRTQKKKRRKHRKDESSDHDSDSSDDSHYRRKRRKDKKHRIKDPIKLCANLTAKISDDSV